MVLRQQNQIHKGLSNTDHCSRMFLAHIAIGSKSMLAANGDKKSFFPKGMQSDRILDRLGGNFFLEALFCKLSSLALSITLGPRNKGLDFANFISNVHSKQGLNETILRTCKIKFTHSYRKDTIDQHHFNLFCFTKGKDEFCSKTEKPIFMCENKTFGFFLQNDL